MRFRAAWMAVALWSMRAVLFRMADVARFLSTQAEPTASSELNAFAHRSYDWAHKLGEISEAQHAG